MEEASSTNNCVTSQKNAVRNSNHTQLYSWYPKYLAFKQYCFNCLNWNTKKISGFDMRVPYNLPLIIFSKVPCKDSTWSSLLGAIDSMCTSSFSAVRASPHTSLSVPGTTSRCKEWNISYRNFAIPLTVNVWQHFC